MKPLTIDELKALQVGDWVWIVYTPSGNGHYDMIEEQGEEAVLMHNDGLRFAYEYKDYGKLWLACKNKEQAESCKDTQTVKLVLQKTGCDNVECTWTDTAIVEVAIPAKYNLDENKHPNNATLTTWHIVGAVTEEDKL